MTVRGRDGIIVIAIGEERLTILEILGVPICALLLTICVNRRKSAVKFSLSSFYRRSSIFYYRFYLLVLPAACSPLSVVCCPAANCLLLSAYCLRSALCFLVLLSVLLSTQSS